MPTIAYGSPISSTGALTVEMEKKTASVLTGTRTTTGTTTLGTVGAGKIWRILGWYWNQRNANANPTFTVLLNDVVWMTSDNNGPATSYVMTDQPVKFDYEACPVLTEGQTVKMTLATANAVYNLNVYYVEESV